MYVCMCAYIRVWIYEYTTFASMHILAAREFVYMRECLRIHLFVSVEPSCEVDWYLGDSLCVRAILSRRLACPVEGI